MRAKDSPTGLKFIYLRTMSLKPVIADIADQADDFLEGVTTHSDARAAISEQLTIKYPALSGSVSALCVLCDTGLGRFTRQGDRRRARNAGCGRFFQPEVWICQS